MPDPSVPPPGTALVQPWTDWEYEAETAAQNSVAAAEKDKNYRNLSGLSPEQLEANGDLFKHMQGAPDPR